MKMVRPVSFDTPESATPQFSGLDPKQLALRDLMNRRLQSKAMEHKPIGTWAGVAAQTLQGVHGAMERGRTDRDLRDARSSALDFYGQALGDAFTPEMRNASGGDLSFAGDALAQKRANEEIALRHSNAQQLLAQRQSNAMSLQRLKDGDGTIPGAGADASFAADQIEYNNTLSRIDNADSMINDSFGIGGTTGLSGALMSNIPGRPAHDLMIELNSLAANIGLSSLQKMKEQSANGSSGLGQVTEKEHELLQQKFGSLRQSQSADHLRRNLANFRDAYQQVRRLTLAKQGINMDAAQSVIGGQQAAPAAPAATPDIQSMPQEELEAIANGQ